MPISRQQYEEKMALLNDPDALGNMTLGELKTMQKDLKGFEEEQQDTVMRLRGQGLNSEQIQGVLDAQLQGGVDPYDTSPESIALQNPQKDIAGLVEGGKQAVEGIADLLYDGVAAVSQWLPEEVAAANKLDPRWQKQWKEDVAANRAERREEQMRTYGELPGPLWELAGEGAPWMVTGNTASGFINMVAKQMMLGGVAGASQYQPSGAKLSDRQEQALWGMGLGTLAGGVMGIPGLLRKKASSKLVRAFNEADPEQREIVEYMVQQMTEDPDFVFSAAELTGTKFYLGLEQSSGDIAQLQARSARIETIYNHLHKRMNELSSRKLSPGAIAGELRNTLELAQKTIYQQAGNNWAAGIKAITKSYGEDFVLDGTSYLQKLDDIIAQEVNPLTNMGAKPSQALLDYRAVVANKVAKGVRGLTAKDIDDIATGLNRLIGEKVKVFDNAAPGSDANIGRALMGALTTSLESEAKNPAAANALRLLRQGYKQDMAVAQAIEDSVFNAVFGGKVKTPGDALDTVMKMEPGDQRQFAKFLQDWQPDLYQDMQRAYLKRMTLKSHAGPNDPDVAGPFSASKLADNLADSFGRQGMAGSGFFDPALQQELKTSAAALRILSNKMVRATPGGPQPEEWTINFISRSPEFFGRFVTRLLASGETLETALLNPQWRHALRTIATEKLGTKKMKAATVYLAQWMGERDAVAQFEQQQREQMAESQEFADERLRRGDHVL